MRKYEVREVSAEVALKDKRLIEPGMAQNYNSEKSGNGDTNLIASYDTVEEAMADLKQRKSSVSLTSSFSGKKYYLVEEYFIEENEYDEDGDWISGDIWEYSEMPCYEIQYNRLMDREKIYWTDSLEDVMEEADEGICYTQEDIIIYENGEEVARRKWYGVEPNEEEKEEEIVEIGGGFYAEWYVN